MLDPNKFGKSYNDFMQSHKDSTEWNYVKKMMHEVLKGAGKDLGSLRSLTREFLQKEDHSGYLEAAKEDTKVNFPKVIFVERLKGITAEDLLKAPCKTQAMLSFYDKVKTQQSCALIFPVKGMGNWVIHNIFVKDRPGSHRIMISTSGAISSAVFIQDFKTFIEEATPYI
jgi:hypothetical protein